MAATRLKCDTCGKEKPAGRFQTRKPPICRACHAVEQSKKDQEALAARARVAKQEITARKSLKDVEKERIRDKIRRERQESRDRKLLDKEAERERSQEELAQEELASRQLARRSLLHYTERMNKGYTAGWVHEDVCRRLERFVEDVEKQRSPRLMLCLPPRSGKSELASVRLPAWVLGKHPEWEFISTSYALELPLKFSRQVRNQINSAEYQRVFDKTKLSRDSTAAESWRTMQGGGFRASGVGGGITGMGAHCFIIDDPFKDHEEADSQSRQELVWNWYSSTAYTRLAPGGGMLVINTRWSDNDLSGQLIRQMNEALREVRGIEDEAMALLESASNEAERAEAMRMFEAAEDLRDTIDEWDIVSYPALAKHDEYLHLPSGKLVRDHDNAFEYAQDYQLLRRKDEALHPERFPKPLLLRYKRTLQPRHWSALYQQEPVPDEGVYFTNSMMVMRPTSPPRNALTIFVAWDLALGNKDHNDWTVGAVGGLDWEDNLWPIHLIRGKWSDTHQIAELILDTHLQFGATITGMEKGVLELAVRPHLDRLMKERGTYIPLAEGDSALKPITDKIIRARPLQGRMQQGTFIFPADQPWVTEAVGELLRFPAGVNDDIVDAFSWLTRLAQNHAPPKRERERARPDADGFVSWRDRLSASMAEFKNFMAR
jgi:predicted phage terminase large subunit-like protein